jgi:hypothetical protein
MMMLRMLPHWLALLLLALLPLAAPATAQQPQLQAHVAAERWPVAVYVTGARGRYGAAAPVT